MAKRGGRREGAGRPVNSGPFREPTKVMRIPLSLLERTSQLLESHAAALNQSKPAAGRISMRQRPRGFSLPRAMSVVDPTLTFLHTIHDDSMNLAGLAKGDRVLVDGDRKPVTGDLVLAQMSRHRVSVMRAVQDGDAFSLRSESTKRTFRGAPRPRGHSGTIRGVVVAMVQRSPRPESRKN